MCFTAPVRVPITSQEGMRVGKNTCKAALEQAARALKVASDNATEVGAFRMILDNVRDEVNILLNECKEEEANAR